MIQSLLVPLDGSSFAEQALPLAASIARRVGATVRLALVHQSPPAPVTPDAAQLYTEIEVALRRSEHEYLERVGTQVSREHGCVTSSVILTGSPGPALERHVEDTSLSLVVMSTHGRGGLARAWLGSVADYLTRSLNVPVLLIRPSETVPEPQLIRVGGRILVPLDGSLQAESVLVPAVDLARAFDAELSLIQVVRPVVLPASLPAPPTAGYDDHLTQVRRAEADEYVGEIAETLREWGVKASAAGVLGTSAAETILDLSRADDVGLIAIATHGRSGLPRLVLGSVADKLVRTATRPVLVCRPLASPGNWRTYRRHWESAAPHA